MRSTAPLSTGMQIAIPLSGASAADTGRLALPESPCCRGRHDFPDEPLSHRPASEGARQPTPFRPASPKVDRPDNLRGMKRFWLRIIAALARNYLTETVPK